VAQQLQDQGFREVYALQGGFDAWKQAGCPVEPKN
jgi:rhodanese-related sulfurtransferase